MDQILLRKPQVLNQRARSSSAHYRDIQNGLFTKPVNLGERAVGWPIREVNILTAAQVAGLSEDEIRNLVVELHAKRKSFFLTLMEV
jgi:prophage regulatory protein